MNMNAFPFEPLDDLTDERVPFMPCFVGAIVDDDDRPGLPGMTDEEYEAFLYNGRSATNHDPEPFIPFRRIDSEENED